MAYLLDKFRLLGKPPLPLNMLNWEGLVTTLIGRQRLQEAINLYEQAEASGEVGTAKLKEQLQELYRCLGKTPAST